MKYAVKAWLWLKQINQRKNKTGKILATGTVKFFNPSKGFGFIVPADGSKEIFVRNSGTNENIRKADNVSYEIQQGKKGLEAVGVRVT